MAVAESAEVRHRMPTEQKIVEMQLRRVTIHHGEWCDWSNNTLYFWYSADGKPIASWSCETGDVILYDENGDPYDDEDLEMECAGAAAEEADMVDVEDVARCESDEDDAAFGIARCESDDDDDRVRANLFVFDHPQACECSVCRGEQKPPYEYEEDYYEDEEGLGTDNEDDEEDED